MGSGGLYWAWMGWVVMGLDVMLFMELPHDDVGVDAHANMAPPISPLTFINARNASLTMVHGECSP